MMFLCLGRSWLFQVETSINITGDRSPKTALQERRSWPAIFTTKTGRDDRLEVDQAAPSMLHAAWLWPKIAHWCIDITAWSILVTQVPNCYHWMLWQYLTFVHLWGLEAEWQPPLKQKIKRWSIWRIFSISGFGQLVLFRRSQAILTWGMDGNLVTSCNLQRRDHPMLLEPFSNTIRTTLNPAVPTLFQQS